VPVRSFLQLAAGGFLRDPKLAFVQTPHHFHSPDPFERNLGTFRRVPNEGDLFYGQIQPGNDAWNAAFFCGSCAVIRRTALDDIGGFAVETVTEDAHTALRMHRRGWRSAYLAVPQASGLATESLAAHVGQRIRWARGMAQIFRIDNPLLGRGLGLMQRLCYASAMLHFFYGLPRLVFLTAPVFFLLFGAHIFNASPATVLAYALPHMAHLVLTSSRLYGHWRHSFWAEVYEAALAVYVLVPTTLALVAPRVGIFKVTAKGGRTHRDWFDKRIAAPYLFLLALNLTAFAAGLWRWRAHPEELDVILINLAWCAYDLLIVGATLAVARERRQVRAGWRVPVAEPVVLRLEGERTLAATAVDLSMGGAALRTAVPCELRPGERLTVGLLVDGVERPVWARVVRTEGGVLRVCFDTPLPAQERWLVRSLFGRADLWLEGWTRREPDRPLRAFARIAGHAFRLALPRRSA
jgi:cellulose synthase (UDP-forming)